MTTEQFHTALLNGLDLLKNAEDALMEIAALKMITDACEEWRIDRYADALEIAEEELNLAGKTSGQFVHEGAKFSLDKKPVFQFVEKPQRYTMQEGIRYRECYSLRDTSKKSVSAWTRRMKAIHDSFAEMHPDWQPDEVQKILKVL